MTEGHERSSTVTTSPPACDARYLHRPAAPDFSRWPFDVPSIMDRMKRHGLTVVLASSLQPAEVFSATGEKWMNRALKAEAQGRDAVKATELLIQMYQQKLSAALSQVRT